MIKILKKVIRNPSGFRSASIILILTTLLSNLLGALRNYFLTRNIPVDSLDVYYASFRLPDLILNLMILGAISSALMPVINQHLEKEEKKEAWHVINSVISLAIVVLFLAAIILFILMPYLTNLIVPDFELAKQNYTTFISRILLLSPLIFGVSYIINGTLNSFHRFFASAISPIVYNLAIIFGVAILSPMFARGDPKQVLVIAFSVVIGALLHLTVQLPSMKHLGYKFCWSLDYKHQSVRKIGKLMIPRSIGLGTNQLMYIFFTALASAQVGSVSYFSLANDIQTMPTVVFGLSFASAIYPALTGAFNQENDKKFSQYITKTSKIIITLMIPVSVLFILLNVGIIQALLGFGLHDAYFTGRTLTLFSVSLVFSGLAPLLARGFFAMHNTRTPTIVSIISTVLSICFALIFKSYGAPGLAFSFSLGSIFNATILYTLLKKKNPDMDEDDIITTFFKVLLISAIMAVVVQLLKGFTSNWFDVVHSRVGVFAQVIICAGVGASLFISLAYIFKIKEVESLWKRGAKN